MAEGSPAVRCSPHSSGLPLPSGLITAYVHPETQKWLPHVTKLNVLITDAHG